MKTSELLDLKQDIIGMIESNLYSGTRLTLGELLKFKEHYNNYFDEKIKHSD